MSRIDDILGNKGKDSSRPQGQPWGGTLYCHTCDEVCTEVEYFVVDKMLRGYCDEGHMTIIEKFGYGG